MARSQQSGAALGATRALGSPLAQGRQRALAPLRLLYPFHGTGGTGPRQPLVRKADRPDTSQAVRLPRSGPISPEVFAPGPCPDLLLMRRRPALLAVLLRGPIAGA